MKWRPVHLAAVVCLCWCVSAEARDDGFQPTQGIESRYTKIFVHEGCELASLARSFSIGPADTLIAGKTLKEYGRDESVLADSLDTLFLEVCSILDMFPQKVQCIIKICRTDDELRQVHTALSGGEPQSGAFYVYDTNTVYISENSFNKQTIARQLSHCIMNRYFAVQPPARILEIMALYVEYQVRKKT